ncbi:MAG: hypothetical protein ACE5OZ_12220 [Candidatus Heimdallarchaeota archaeon]
MAKRKKRGRPPASPDRPLTELIQLKIDKITLDKISRQIEEMKAREEFPVTFSRADYIRRAIKLQLQWGMKSHAELKRIQRYDLPNLWELEKYVKKLEERLRIPEEERYLSEEEKERIIEETWESDQKMLEEFRRERKKRTKEEKIAQLEILLEGIKTFEKKESIETVERKIEALKKDKALES